MTDKIFLSCHLKSLTATILAIVIIICETATSLCYSFDCLWRDLVRITFVFWGTMLIKIIDTYLQHFFRISWRGMSTVHVTTQSLPMYFMLLWPNFLTFNSFYIPLIYFWFFSICYIIIYENVVYAFSNLNLYKSDSHRWLGIHHLRGLVNGEYLVRFGLL